MKPILASCCLVLAPVSAAQDMTVCVEQDADDLSLWSVTATYNTPLDPGVEIGTVWADAYFQIEGDGSDILFVPGSDNPAYSAGLGPVSLTDGVNGSPAEFIGSQAGPTPFGPGTADPSNPLSVVQFTYSGDVDVLNLWLVGLNTVLFLDGSTFGDIQFYTDPFRATQTFEVVIKPIPAPASAVLIGVAGFAAARRRRA